MSLYSPQVSDINISLYAASQPLTETPVALASLPSDIEIDRSSASSAAVSGSPTDSVSLIEPLRYNIDDGFHQMHHFTLYETATRYYVVGCDVSEKHHRILKIARSVDNDGELSIVDDKTVYTQKEMKQLLDMIDNGNKPRGGIRLRCTMWGILGFIRFTGPYYMHIITKKSTVAIIGGHHVYQIEGTELISLAAARNKSDTWNTEESRFLAVYTALDLTRCFYFSYSYDITHTLQHNIAQERDRLAAGLTARHGHDFNSMFVWNSFLVKPIQSHMDNPWAWCCATIHGYLEQRGKSSLSPLMESSLPDTNTPQALNVFGRIVHVTLIARRSRHFAGVRFLKRGITSEVSHCSFSL